MFSLSYSSLNYVKCKDERFSHCRRRSSAPLIGREPCFFSWRMAAHGSHLGNFLVSEMQMVRRERVCKV